MKKSSKNYNFTYKPSSPSYPRQKKSLGQHFIRTTSVVTHMIKKVSINHNTFILEVGCGDGFLTKAILQQTQCKKLICFEIDSEWSKLVRTIISDTRLIVIEQNILTVDSSFFNEYQPLIILANIPYQITFPLLFLLQKNKHFIQEGVIMVQEEVAQKIVAKQGKTYNATSIFLQHHFSLELMEKVPPEAFDPPPKVFSRLLYFKPNHDCQPISNEEQFWKFVRSCFRFPRQTIKNNLRTTHYPIETISPEIQQLRAQQLSFQNFLSLWNQIVDSQLSL